MTIYRGVGGSGDSATGEDVFGDNSSITSLNGISGAIQTPTYIKFASAANHTANQGELTWNTAEGTLDLGLNHGGVVLQIGQELHYRVTNQSGSNIGNGVLVSFVGTTGNSGKLLVAKYNGTQASKSIIGLTTEPISNGATGYVTCFGKVRGIQTNGANYGETWLDGDILYPSPSGLTKVLPQAPAAKSPVAVVVNAHGSNGELFVRVQSGTTLAEDELVQLTSPTNGDILQYNATAGRFENVDASVVAGSIPDGDKGDIVVSAGGTTWTIDTGVIGTTKLGGDITTAGKNLLDDATVADQRTTLGVTATGADTTYAYRANNLSDLSDAITARTNLGLGSIATQGDGDKGDISVSASGATWTIDNDAVTYAKMQNISATSRILGRKTAAAGDTEECTLSEVLDFIGSAAQGDILYRGASAWARLPAGTSGNFLKTQGAGANPTWDAASGITLLGTLTTTSGSTAVLGSLSLTNYSKLFVVVNGVSFTANVFITINSNQVSAPLGTTFTDALYGFIDIDLTSSIGIGIIQSSTPPLSSALLGTAGRIFNSGLTTASTSITFAGGTFDAGTIKVYGVR